MPADPHPEVLNAETYPDFRRQLRESDCQRCALAVRRQHIVVDRGNPDAAIIAVGEAPGREEDARGIAFCGRAGRKLDELFTAEGLSTDQDLLLVNVVKCRPPGNRDPQPEEMASCQPFLERQLEFSPARFIALMGTTALRQFAPERRPFARPRGPVLSDRNGRDVSSSHSTTRHSGSGTLRWSRSRGSTFGRWRRGFPIPASNTRLRSRR